MDLKIHGRTLLIHHWDADGICAARLLLEKYPDTDITNVTPHLGNYYLTDDELAAYEEYDTIIIADMAIPEDNIQRLAEHADIFIFDHHLQPEIKFVFHHNPIIKGANPDDYPSASWIVNDFLENSVNLFALLGIIGDHEQKIQRNSKFSTIIYSFCDQHNLTFNQLLSMVYLLDSNYKLGDKQAVEQAPRLLQGYTAEDILTNKTWNKNLTRLNTEITKQLNLPHDTIDGIIYKKIDTPYNIISTITRKVAWDSGQHTLVVNTGFFQDKDQIYMRSTKNAQPMIQRGKQLGFKCGGKKEVLGAIVPKDKTGPFVQEILAFLQS